MAEDKQGEVNIQPTSSAGTGEPEEIAAEDASGAQEQPTERQLDREQAIADEPVAESEPPAADQDDEVGEEPTPRVKPAIPGADLEVDIVREGEDALRDDPYAEYDEDTGELVTEAEDDLSQPIADAAIDLG